MKSSLIVAAATTSCAHAFVSAPASSRTPMSLNMGLFDGVKEAFGGDGMGDISSERETPIDRWMGWNAKSTEVQGSVSKGTFYCQIHPYIIGKFCVLFILHGIWSNFDFFFQLVMVLHETEPANFVDSMDKSNYITATLVKPMGIVFEENDAETGGIFVLDISEGSAEADGTVRPGDQLVSVGDKKVSGLQFEEALGTIIDSTDENVKLNFFRGPAKFLYGPAGASQEWLDDFIGA